MRYARPLSRILVVDDDASQRLLLRRLLEREGWRVVEAGDAEAAQDLLAKPLGRPDLILCDLILPGRDGAAFLQGVRADPKLSAIPAILMTGARLPAGLLAAASRALESGPVFIKSSDYAPLIRRARELLKDPGASRVRIDPLKRAIWIDGCRLPRLAPRRFELLCALLRSDRAVSREELLDLLWDEEHGASVVDVTVLRLRDDLRTQPVLSIATAVGGYLAVLAPYCAPAA